MCRLLGYLGSPILLDYILCKPEHSLVVQSYQPREMTSGLLNADGFGIGWYHKEQDTEPFTYKNIQPIWNDINLPHLSRYIESGCIIANIRSATTGQAVDLSNCQPFNYDRILFTHNGSIENFRKTLYRPLGKQLNDRAYQAVYGNTDSEHIFGLIINQLQQSPHITLENAIQNAIGILKNLAKEHQTHFSASLLLSDGKRLIACRTATKLPAPSLYWLRDDPIFPESVIIASEPLFPGNWNSCPEHSIISVGENLDIQIAQL